MRNVIETDVVVVGARCAGASTAMLLARQGVEVTLVDRATELDDTLSTHAISRGGVVQLHRWGLLGDVVRAGTPEIRSVSFQVDGETTRRTVKARAGVDMLVAPRRRVLDNIVLDAAARAGADVRLGTTVTAVIPGRVTAVDPSGRELEIRARLVVGADGLRSRVAQHVGAGVVDQRPSTAGGIFGYFAGDWDGFEFHLGEGSFTGVFPTNDGVACVWVITPAAGIEAARRATPSPDAAFAALVRETAPALATRLGSSTERVRMALRFPNVVRRGAGPGWALVGDAGYHRDPITGHGITDAFRDAELLATAIVHDEIDTYEQARLAALAPIFDVTCELAGFPPLARFVELQKQLSDHIEAEAMALASMPDTAATLAAA